MPHPADSLEQRARRIRLMLFDVDGVLTDGTLTIHADGSESKSFHIKDGAAIVWAQRAGLQVGVLSARSSAATAQRAAQLALRIVHQGVASKSAAFERILQDTGLDADAACYMGDDLLDLPVLLRAGLAAAPADAALEVREAAHWVSDLPGGRGAARQLIEFVLRTQERWHEVLDDHRRRG